MKAKFNKFLTLLAVLLFGVGSVWGALTAHVPGVYEKTVATGGYGCTLTTVASGENAGTFEVYYFSAQSKYGNTTDVYGGAEKQQYRLMCTDSDSEYQLINRNGTGTFTASCDWIEMAYGVTGFSKSDYTFGSNKFNEFFEITPNGGNTGITKTCYIKPKEGDVLTLKVSGYVEFAILGNDNSSSKYMTITVDGGTPTSWKSNTLSRRSVTLTTGEHTIVVANVGTSANAFYGFSLKLPSCAAGAPGNISKGTLSAGVLTLNAAGSAASGDTWYWQSSATGTDKTNSGSSFDVSAAGTYYIRSYNTADDCWSNAKSITISATDLVANYTVIYKDGTTELGSEVVAVGDHPAGIADPTKDCYTFAGWLNGSTPVADVTALSGAADEEIELTATWTANYASGTYSFVNVAEVGTAPNKLTMTDGSTVNVLAGSRVDNIYFSAMAIKYESGASDVLTDYKGWKINTNAATIKFLVENDCQVKIAIGEKTAINVTYTPAGGAETTVSQAKDTETPYNVEGGTLVTLTTTSSNTTTLKKIAINSLFDVTYTDGTGDASDVANGVAQVTLPAPTETTVGGSTFTGWTANQIVKVGGVDQAIGTEITAGTVVELTANTTFTAVWVTTSNFDVRFFPGYGANDQIGTTQSISTGNYATPEADPTREGYRFLGWSTDGTEANIEDVTAYGITAATDFTAVWIQQFDVTFNLQGYGAAIAAQKVDNGGKVAKPSDPSEGGQEFGGWYKEATCTNAWDFATDVVTSATELFAKWTAFTGCAMLVPATSGSALADGDEVDLQASSTGGSIYALAKSENLTYTANGLQFGSTSGVKARVVLNNDLAVGTTISMKLVAAGTGTRGLFLYTSAGTKINAFTCWVDGTNPATNGAVETFTYTVTAGDGLEGTNEFQLWRNNTVILNTLKVESCGSAVIFHDLTSAVDPAGMGTVTLSASSVREGHTATAEYSAIDPAYEFDEWQISGTDASIADASANPAVITMGTADAVVTLKLKVATVKHTVSFNTHGGSAVASQEVEDGANPVAPAEPTKDEYIFQGWAEVEDGAIVDVTSFTITADKEFHAVWVAEPAGIKLINGDGSINTTDFTTGVTASTVNFDDADHNCAAFGSTGGSIVGLTGLNKVVAYNATTTQTKVKFVLYNTNSSSKELYLQKVLEGATEAVTETIAVPSKERYETVYYTFNSSDLRSFYVTVNSTNIQILQMKVIEDGTTLKRAGEAGYELNLNLGRVLGAQNEEVEFEGLTITPSSNAKVLNSTELQIKTPMSFSIAAPLTLTVTTNSAKYYVSQNSAEDGTTATAITAAGTETFDLTATGTWYIVPSTTSAVKLTNIAFSAPKCEQPTITTQPATKIDFPAGDMTATVVAEVSDGGTLSYQWYDASDDSEVAGATDATLTTTTEGAYYVIVTNSLADHADNFIKSDNATLGYIDLTDATLSALSYGGTSITLSDGVYEYDVNLPEGTTDVPVLAATATMAAYGATAVPTDATAFVSYEATSTVLVTAANGTSTQTYTVNFHVAHTIASLVDVSTDMTWDFSQDGLADGAAVGTDVIMANVAGVVNDANFKSDNIMVTANKQAGAKLQASMIKFHTTVNGIITVVFSNTGNKSSERYLVVNGVKTDVGSKDKNAVTYCGFVPAGDVVLTVVDGDGNMLNFTSIDFVAKAAPDYTRSEMLGNGVLGTICLPNNVPAGQTLEATFYELVGKNGDGKIVFAEVTNGLEAGKPYVFQAKGDNLALYYGSTHVDDPINTGALKGTFGATTIANTDPNWANIYYFAKHALYSCADLTSLNLPANRAYLLMNEVGTMSPKPGRRYITLDVHGQQTATGFENLENGEAPVKVMINGQMYILRGEKMYNANGQIVK